MRFTIRACPEMPCGRLAVREERMDGATAVFADVLGSGSLDPDCGAIISIDCGALTGAMCDWRHTEFWCRPAFISRLSDVPEETYTLVGQRPDGSWLVMMAVTGSAYKCVLTGTTEGLCARLFSWAEGINRCDAPAFVWAEGEEPYALLEACAEAGSRAAGGFCPVRRERAYPELFSYLGWCSWDAMEIRVSHEDLLKKAREFREKNIPVRWAILDDMWADVPDFVDAPYETREEMFTLMHASALRSFRAAPERFPQGLGPCIQALNELGLRVGVWHPTTGYWRGIDPDGPIFRELRDCLVQTKDGRWIPAPDKASAFRFFDAFHTYLQSCGAEFVKVDNQSMIRRFYKGMGPVGAIARDIHTAIDASAGAHFGLAVINCMGMASEDQWSRPASAVSRCSDDFQPEDRAWFTKHILQCAYNAMTQGQLYWCDWDMWWTDDGQAVKNSILRAMSGGPIYVSDKLDRSRAEILRPLCLSDGRILRCDRPAMPIARCILPDPELSGALFTLQNLCGDTGVVASFDLDRADEPVSGYVSPRDVPGLPGEEFAVWERFTGELRILRREERWDVTLRDRDDYRLWLMAPYADGFAAFGMEEKFIAPAAIRARVGRHVELHEHGTYLYVENGILCREER